MQLLERAPLLETLTRWFERARDGRGVMVFIAGEAGIGKSALVSHFAESKREPARVLWGNCEAMSTPTPLGALQDIALQLADAGSPLPPLDVPRIDLFAACLNALRGAPTVAVFEDVHWADAATLDLLRYFGRRADRTRALLIATYRDDELGPSHPLRVVLGDLASAGVQRLTIPPLTADAVRTLAGSRGIDAAALHAATGGNAFFVTEALGAGGIGIPPTVRDAVLARAARLPPSARAVLEYAAVAGPRVEPWLLAHLAAAEADAIAQCEASGMLRIEGGRYTFRHELARQAILESLAPARRVSMHEAVLLALRTAPSTRTDLARLAHHANLAEDADAVLHFAPLAARQAAARGAHREAAAQYAAALQYADRLEAGQRAALIEARAYECYLISDIEAAIAARQVALQLARATGNALREGENLRWLSRLHWFLGHGEDAERCGAAAVQVLQALPHGPELAMAFSNLSQLKMLAEDVDAAVAWGRRAIELAERLDATEILAHALNNVGASLDRSGDPAGAPQLERSLALALEHGLEEHAARAYCNLASHAISQREYGRAEPYLAAGIAYCADHDLDSWSHYLMAWRTRSRFDQGRWDEAALEAAWLCERSGAAPIARIPALAVLGHVRVRRGDPGAAAALDEGHALACSSGELQRIWPVAVARAEAAWLQGDAQRCVAEVRTCFELARLRRNPWALGETGLCLRHAGALAEVPDGCAAPFALQLRGEWRAAAAAWQALGCPYEQACALADGDAAAQIEALAIFDRLGAAPAARRLREAMRACGERSIPRGPRAATRANRFGLTPRELDILALLAHGLSNAQIAGRRHRSVRTVDHHVASILAKLDAATRNEAVAQARAHDLLTEK